MELLMLIGQENKHETTWRRQKKCSSVLWHFQDDDEDDDDENKVSPIYLFPLVII